MASVGVHDFIHVLETLEQEEQVMGLMWGRCPDCKGLLQSADNIPTLIDIILSHECDVQNAA